MPAGSLVAIQTGTDLTVKPRTAAVTTTTTVFDPPGVKTNNAFSAPSTTNEALMPYDPRACNAADNGPATAVVTAKTKKG